MKLGICLRTNIQYVVIFVIFLGTMTVLSHLSPGDNSSDNKTGYAYEQASKEQALTAQLPPKLMGLKITSPVLNQNVPVGELQISGTSTDNAATDCQVLVDVNDMKPFQKAIPTGPDGRNDYSTWSFKYTDAYHLITEGDNELTAKLSCSDKEIKPKWHSVNITGVAKKPAPGNILFTTVVSDESSLLLSNKTQQASPGEEQKLKIANPGGVNKTTNSTDSPYPDVLLEEESTNATDELSTAGVDEKLGAVKESSAVKVKEAKTTTPTDSPYPDVLLEEESTEGKEEKVNEEVQEEPEAQSHQEGQQDGQQQLSEGDEKSGALKVKEARAKELPSALLEEELTDDKEEMVKAGEEEVEEQPEMKSSLQTFDTDDEQKVPANEQLHLGQTEDHVMDSTEDTYTTIMSNLDKDIDDDIPSGYDMHDYAFKK